MNVTRAGLAALLIGTTLGCATTRTIPGVPSGIVPEGVYNIPAHMFEITTWHASKVPNGSYSVPAHSLVVAPRHQMQSELLKRIKEREALFGYRHQGSKPMKPGERVVGFYDILTNEIWCPSWDFDACYDHEREHAAGLVNWRHEVTIGKQTMRPYQNKQ